MTIEQWSNQKSIFSWPQLSKKAWPKSINSPGNRQNPSQTRLIQLFSRKNYLKNISKVFKTQFQTENNFDDRNSAPTSNLSHVEGGEENV